MVRIHLRSIIAGALLLVALPAPWVAAQTGPAATPDAAAAAQGAPAAAQGAPDGALQITWEVRNRFRLFREERDFLLHAESMRGGGVLSSEQKLESQGDGRGWARN